MLFENGFKWCHWIQLTLTTFVCVFISYFMYFVLLFSYFQFLFEFIYLSVNLQKSHITKCNIHKRRICVFIMYVCNYRYTRSEKSIDALPSISLLHSSFKEGKAKAIHLAFYWSFSRFFSSLCLQHRTVIGRHWNLSTSRLYGLDSPL